MNILIVYSHPSKESYTFQILKQLESVLTEQRWNVEITDLYAQNFQSSMTEQEYHREGSANTTLPVSEDVLKEHKKIEKADCIIFLYPLWWSDCPAIMKGWFDRVYSVGYAYGHQPSLPKMKVIKYGIAICTAGHPNDFLNKTGIEQSMRTIMLNDRLGNRFENKEMFILGGTLSVDRVKEKHKSQINQLANTIKALFSQE
ncbi:NAD(P)H-dependent oxidoreductase [Sphingobacterium shayense]|uniref:NAD(P)H-dependent oxidoreductase n=1 Tax=Sphingobacterium shayense TaxID=626343 RepID=UPI0015516A76|nr:NAD(P)H-dependent oxidoreductase [Sphingobacterium shayense]NQD70191.1 NAD(P)H-dependent oxidoreductase [Sphingobacterium shayense]